MGQRQDIVNAIKATLLNQTQAGARVYLMRDLPTDDSELPCILLHPSEETSEALEVTSEIGVSPDDDRSWDLNVDIIVKDHDPADSELLTIMDEVDALLRADVSLGGKADDLAYMGAIWPPRNLQAAHVVRMVRETWRADYTSPAP